MVKNNKRQSSKFPLCSGEGWESKENKCITFSLGDKVTYSTTSETQIGIVKGPAHSSKFVFVVYNCGNNWDKYRSYTGALTPVNNLVHGWPKKLF